MGARTPPRSPSSQGPTHLPLRSGDPEGAAHHEEEEGGKQLKGVWGVLATKNKWTSEELVRLLEQQLEHKTLLMAKKGAAESEAERLTTQRKKNVKAELDALYKSFLRLKASLNKMTKEKLPSRLERPDFYRNVEKADELEKGAAYLTVLNFITSTSTQIEANVDSHLETEAIELFHRLKRIKVAYLNITECSHLQKYGNGVITFWEQKLACKLVLDFERLLEAFGWPLRLKTATPTLEMHERLHKVVMNLSKLSTTVHEDALEKNVKQEGGTETAENLPFTPILPIKILMVPIKRRFCFHFLSDKPTNESSRPEWYFSQLKQWLHDLIPFVKTHLEQVTVSEIGISSIIEFVHCVSEMLVAKVEAHLHDDLRDGVFVKVLEEAITFENDIGDLVVENATSISVSYLPPFVNTVFSRPSILKRWLAAERTACLEKLDDMFSSTSAWNKPIIPGPPEIVDLFIAVIRSLTDRFAHLQTPPQRLQFLHLLNDLLEEFHVRCLQTWKSKTECDDYLSKDVLIDYLIADALNSVHNTLQEWEYLPFFSSLYFYSKIEDEDDRDLYSSALESNSFTDEGLDDTEAHKSNGIFSNACSLFWCLAEEIQAKWCLKIIKKLRDELQPYCKIKWQNHEKTLPPERITEQLVIPLRTLKEVGKAVSSTMDKKGAQKWMKKLAVKCDEMLIEAVIFPNQFTMSAVLQVNFDFINGFFAVFGDNGVNEKLFFGSISSALTILQLSTGEAMLLYDTLMNGNFEAHEIALAELSISICQSEVIKVLRNRCDLHV